MNTWTALLPVDDCPPGSAVECVANGQIIAVFNVDGTFYALDGMCPHQGGPLGNGELQGNVVTCPWHGFQFDVTTGQHETSPQYCQKTFPTKIDEDQVWVAMQNESRQSEA